MRECARAYLCACCCVAITATCGMRHADLQTCTGHHVYLLRVSTTCTPLGYMYRCVWTGTHVTEGGHSLSFATLTVTICMCMLQQGGTCGVHRWGSCLSQSCTGTTIRLPAPHTPKGRLAWRAGCLGPCYVQHTGANPLGQAVCEEHDQLPLNLVDPNLAHKRRLHHLHMLQHQLLQACTHTNTQSKKHTHTHSVRLGRLCRCASHV